MALQQKPTAQIRTIKKSTPTAIANGEPSLLDYAIAVIKYDYVNFEGRARRKGIDKSGCWWA